MRTFFDFPDREGPAALVMPFMGTLESRPHSAAAPSKETST
jgi:hypothetical protein